VVGPDRAVVLALEVAGVVENRDLVACSSLAWVADLVDLGVPFAQAEDPSADLPEEELGMAASEENPGKNKFVTIEL
jgi:hypothetical protein